MYKGSKMKGGLIGITEMKSWLLIMQRQPTKSTKQWKFTLQDAADMKRRKCNHSENTKSRESKDE